MNEYVRVFTWMLDCYDTVAWITGASGASDAEEAVDKAAGAVSEGEEGGETKDVDAAGIGIAGVNAKGSSTCKGGGGNNARRREWKRALCTTVRDMLRVQRTHTHACVHTHNIFTPIHTDVRKYKCIHLYTTTRAYTHTHTTKCVHSQSNVRALTPKSAFTPIHTTHSHTHNFTHTCNEHTTLHFANAH
jgi:hypothetical protein